MGKSRFIWWTMVRNALYEYPQWQKELAELRRQSITAASCGMSEEFAERPGVSPHAVRGGNMATRTTEGVALREFDPWKQKMYDAITEALAALQHKRDGDRLRKIIEMKYFGKSHTLTGAALHESVSWETARDWHGYFMRDVAERVGIYFG